MTLDPRTAAVVEDMIAPRGEEQLDTQSVRLSPSDCGYLANEFAFVLKLCSEAASSGDKGAAGLSAMLQQLLQTIAAAMTREDKECKAAVRERGLLRNVSELLRAAIAREQGQKGGSSTHGTDKAMRDVSSPPPTPACRRSCLVSACVRVRPVPTSMSKPLCEDKREIRKKKESRAREWAMVLSSRQE